MKNLHNHRSVSKRGFTIIEVVIGVAIIAVVMVFIASSVNLLLSTSERMVKHMKALYLAEEGIELLYYLRDDDWNALSALSTTGSTYYLDIATSTIALTNTSSVIDGTFTRTIEIERAKRDGDNDLNLASGGVTDSDTLVVTIDVAWDDQSVSLMSLVTNIHDI